MHEAFIRTISASQDVLALTMAWQQFPEVGRIEARYVQAAEHLNSRWAELVKLRRGTTLAEK